MKYINLETNEVVEPTNFTTFFAYANNSNYKLIEEGENSDELNDDLVLTDLTDNGSHNLDEDLETNDENNKNNKKDKPKKHKQNETEKIEEGENSDEIQG